MTTIVHQTVVGTTDRLMTTAAIAGRHGCAGWQVIAAIRRGFLAEPPRCGQFRCWGEEDVARVGEALRAAGYLTQTEGDARGQAEV